MVSFLFVKDAVLLEKGYDSKIFSKKRKQKYPRNKYFSYSGMNRDDKNFSYKDFRNSSSIHSTFKRCEFFGTLFKKSKLKYCSFGGATFTGITFINCNFKGSRFLGATFDNCIFDNCNFQKSKFKNAKFINTYTRNSSFLGASGLKLDLKKYDINELKFANDSLISDLRLKYKNTNVESLINNIDLSRLLMLVELDRLEQILDILKENEKIQIVTFSHVLSKVR